MKLKKKCKVIPTIWGLSCNPTTGDVFLADYSNGLVIVLSLGKDNQRVRVGVAFRSQNPNTPSAVCFMRATQTLLVCNFKDIEYTREAPQEFSLVALSLDGNKWVERSRLQFAVPEGWNGPLSFRTLCELADSYLLFGVESFTTLYRLQVDPTHQTRFVEEIPAPAYTDMAAIVVNGETRVVLTHGNRSLTLYSLCGVRLEQLSRLDLNGGPLWARVLWAAGRLLVAEEHEESDARSVWELDVTGDRLARREELLSETAGMDISCWCAEGHTVTAWDRKTSDICVFEYAPS